jgi:tetratricopeptide (TPR) repeat protein
LERENHVEEAEQLYRQALADFSKLNEWANCSFAAFRLGQLFEKAGRIKEAEQEYLESIAFQEKLGKTFPHHLKLPGADLAEAHLDLGNFLSRMGRLEEAISEFREALRIKNDNINAQNNLKNALAWRDTLAKLPAIISGEAKAADAAERLRLAILCQHNKQWHAGAVRFYREAFADKSQLANDLNAQHRYNAACSAALAGCGQGKDADKLDAKQRAGLRQQALDWLLADLQAYRQLREKSADKAGPAIAQRMQHWLDDPDFASVRGEKVLDQLPKEERSAWRKLWADVAELLAQTRATAPSPKKPDAK